MNTAAVLSHPITLPPLPYEQSALEPVISANTLDFHYGKHHKTYVDTLNKLIEGKNYAKMSLEDIIEESSGNEADTKIFNNAAQVWNHNFFWHCLKKNGNAPSNHLIREIDKAFGSLDEFKKKFHEAAIGQFGSGWAWLVLDQGKLAIVKTANAVNPLSRGQKALLTCDVWEHAYYLDYQNKRADMVQAFLDHMVNWDFVANSLETGHTGLAGSLKA